MPFFVLSIQALYLLSAATAQFLTGDVVAPIAANDVPEASGLAASWRNPDILWTHNDSGEGPLVHALKASDGTYLGAYHLGVKNIDIEDIAVGPGPEPEVSYLYIADIGNNDYAKPSRDSIMIYRVKEPPSPSGGEIIKDALDVDILTFYYPSTNKYIDAETLLIDSDQGELLILRKQNFNSGGGKSSVYATPPNTIFAPGSLDMILEDRGFVEADTLTAGDVSMDGQEILIKKPDRIYYFQRSGYSRVSDALTSQNGVSLPYEKERQGEAITFSSDLSGYYTLSESVGQEFVPLQFYPRKVTPLPTLSPSYPPTREPTHLPSAVPSFAATLAPTLYPTSQPSTKPLATIPVRITVSMNISDIIHTKNMTTSDNSTLSSNVTGPLVDSRNDFEDIDDDVKVDTDIQEDSP